MKELKKKTREKAARKESFENKKRFNVVEGFIPLFGCPYPPAVDCNSMHVESRRELQMMSKFFSCGYRSAFTAPAMRCAAWMSNKPARNVKGTNL